jgi:chitinase
LIAAGYTHINAAYAWVDPDNLTIAYMTNTDDDIWRRLVALKQTNPGLQVWLSIGGWLMNSQTELTAGTFERLVGGDTVESGERLKQFSDSLLSVLEEYGFDGVDMDW